MTARTKIFLLWLLAFAIPVQGFAAAVQVACAPSHQMQAFATMPMPVMEQSEHADHRDHMAGAVHAMAQDQQDHGGQQHPHKTSHASCSSCTVCTIGAVLPLALDKLIDLPFAADIHVAMVQHGFVGYTPENPERPPSHLA